MTLSTSDYSYFSRHVYGDMDNAPSLQNGVEIKKSSLLSSDYQILEVYDNPRTGYQGAIYRNETTHEIVVAHRGTEFNLGQGLQDAAIADGGMVLEAINSQMPDAMRLMERARALSQLPENLVNGHPAPISTTGHSLGGYLAEYTAFKTGVPGETFNAYGAAGLHGVAETRGAHGVINHVRATDFVSAGNAHFGEVRVYATQADIDALASSRTGATQQGSAGFVYDVVNNVNAHKMGESFWPPATSVISEENRQRYRDNARLVNAFRDDVLSSREVITFASQFNQLLHGDPGALKHLATTPLPKVPDHLERSVINGVIHPGERLVEATRDLGNGATRINGVVAEQSTTYAGRAVGATVEFHGRVQSGGLDIVGDVIAQAHATQGRVQQQVITQAGNIAGAAIQAKGEVVAGGQFILGRAEALGERAKGETQGVIFSLTANVYRVGGLFSNDYKEQAEQMDRTASFFRQIGIEKSRDAIQRADTGANQTRHGANASADTIERNAAAFGQAQRQHLERSGALINGALDASGQRVRKDSEQSADAVRRTSADLGSQARQTIHNGGATIDRVLNSAGQNLRETRHQALDAVTNPRSAEGISTRTRGPGLADMGHPHHSLYVQAHAKLEIMGARTGFRSHQELDNVAGALAAEAARQGLKRIDQVVIGKDGERFFAVEGEISFPGHHRIQVDTAQARQQTLEQSTQQANQVRQTSESQEQQSRGMRM